jgi:hypothetical protein
MIMTRITRLWSSRRSKSLLSIGTARRPWNKQRSCFTAPTLRACCARTRRC